MKQILSLLQNSKKKLWLTLFVAIIAIWYIGPLVAIAGKIPLISVWSRVIAMLIAITSILGLQYKKYDMHSLIKSEIPQGQSEEIKNELNILHKSLKDALKVLYSNIIKLLLRRYRKPWYLLLGPASAGKSTLLTKTDLPLKGLDNLPSLSITPTQYCDWWISEEAVFLDLSGKYLKETPNEANNIYYALCDFFKLLKRYRRQQPISGLILAINLQELIINIKQQIQLKKLCQIIQELSNQFTDFPIYLIITRCDLIEGFSEFFEDLGPEERDQIFGISFPLIAQPQLLPQLFSDEYNSLLKRLNDRVIWRLHHENNIDKQAKIKNFPLQMEFLKNPLAKLLNIILPNTDVNLRGIYFTSAVQKEIPIDNLLPSLSHAFNIPQTRTDFRSVPPKNFFIKELFKRIILPETLFFDTTVSTVSHEKPYTFIKSFIILLSGLCIFFFFNDYQYNLHAIQNIKKIVAGLPGSVEPSTDPLENLNLLQSILAGLDKTTHTWQGQLGMRQANQIKSRTKKAYNELLTTKFLSYLQNTLEAQLQTIKTENMSTLYATLKAYLMLGDTKHHDKQFLQNWFENYWHQSGYDNNKQKQLMIHLTTLLNNPLPHVAIDDQLIERTRYSLNSMPQSKLVLTILQNHYQKSPIKLPTNNVNDTFKNLPSEISGIYNIANFRDVYYIEIPKTCQEITSGNWVLGNRQQPAFSEIMLNQLATEAKTIYLNEYLAVWSDILAKLKIDNFQSLNQIAQTLELLNNPRSPIVELINIINRNTQPISDSIEFTQQVSSHFLALNVLASNVMNNTNQNTLMAVKEYLNKIVKASDVEKASYELARARMLNHGENDAITTLLQQARLLPEPIQTWHTAIAAESWRMILKNTQNYLNRIWVTNVYPQYLATLDKRYPIFKESTTDISLPEFTNFFAVGGSVDIFFKNYLQPFVDNSRLYWEWKNIDGQRINISQTTLEMFIRAALIQKMFFPEDSRIPAINFSLVPVELSPNIQNFTLDLDGQIVIFQKDNEQIISLNWPGPQPNHATITFLDDQGKKLTLSESGSWAWFRILDKSHLESTASPKHFRLSFDLEKSSAQYELYTGGVVNPFIPGILNAFRCPEGL
jgi:type VI secretion system protein ImpL